MWKVHGSAIAVALLAFASVSFGAVEASANDTFINQNISGFNLPGVQLPQGHDEVRAADGTTCRSAVSGSGAYLDVGLIGNPEQSDNGSYSAYGRLVVPLGRKTPRVDCTRLYDLEVQRLEMELRLMQMGLTRGIAPAGETSASGEVSEDGEMELASGNWDDDGWSTEGLKEQE